MLDQIAAFECEEAMASWAHAALAVKNRLNAEDAKQVTAAFETRLVWANSHRVSHENSVFDEAPSSAGAANVEGNLPAKNTLTAADARVLEEAFWVQLQGTTPIETAPANASPPLANKTNAEIGAPTELLPRAGSPTDRRSENSGDEDNSRGSHGRGIDKSVLTLNEPRRRAIERI
jgi:hypothetical protein